MQKTLFISLFGMIFQNICFAQTKTVLQNIEMNTLTHDFGQIPRGQEVEFVFELNNQTEQPQIIDNVRTTCGCTAASWQEDPILPKKISRLPISFDAHNSGHFKKKITIFLHAFRKPIVLTIEGEVL